MMRSVFISTLFAICMTYTMIAAEADKHILESELSFIQTLHQAQLTRLSDIVLQEALNKNKHVSDPKLRLYQLRSRLSNIEHQHDLDACKKLRKRIPQHAFDDSSLLLEYALCIFNYIEIMHLNKQELDVKSISKHVSLINNAIQQQERQLHHLAGLHLQHLRQQTQANINNLRYCRGWLHIYLAQISNTANTSDSKAHWLQARSDLEHFIDGPLSNQRVIRSIIAVSNADTALGEHKDACYLLRDVEEQAHNISLNAIMSIWQQHLQLAENNVPEQVYLASSLHAFLMHNKIEHNREFDQLRFSFINMLLMIPNKKDLWALRALSHIDQLFLQGSEYSTYCLPLLTQITKQFNKATRYQGLIEAQEYFHAQEYDQAIIKFESVLFKDRLILNKTYLSKLSQQLAQCYIIRKQYAAAERILSQLSNDISNKGLKDSHLRLWAQSLKMQVHGGSQQALLERYQSVLNTIATYKNLNDVLLTHILHLIQQRHNTLALTFLKALQKQGYQQHNITILSQYAELTTTLKIRSNNEVESLLKSMHKQDALPDALVMKFVYFDLIHNFNQQALRNDLQYHLLIHVDTRKDLSDREQQRALYYFIQLFINTDRLEHHLERMQNVLRIGPQNNWQAAVLLKAAQYLDKTDSQKAYPYCIEAYEHCLNYYEQHFPQASHKHIQYDIQFSLSNVLMRDQQTHRARQILDSLPQSQLQTWKAQEAKALSFERDSDYQKAIELWRNLANASKGGSTQWLTAKLHIAECLHQTDNTEAALKLIKYVKAMHELSPSMKRQYTALEKRLLKASE